MHMNVCQAPSEFSFSIYSTTSMPRRSLNRTPTTLNDPSIGFALALRQSRGPSRDLAHRADEKQRQTTAMAIASHADAFCRQTTPLH